MTRKSYLTLMTMLTMMFLTACSKRTQEPRLVLRHNDEQLKVIHYGDRYNKTEEDIEKRLKDYMIGKKFEELPIISVDQEIVIENTNFDVKECEVHDLILDTEADIISDFNREGSLVSVLENGQAYFKIVDTPEFEKYGDDTVDGKNIHCLLIKCKIEKSKFTFATLVLVSK